MYYYCLMVRLSSYFILTSFKWYCIIDVPGLVVISGVITGGGVGDGFRTTFDGKMEPLP